MNKNGFTLAEILITLGIIGTIAALTTPMLVQNVGEMRIAPRLAKAKATFENAAKTSMYQNNADTILEAAANNIELCNLMMNNIKMIPVDNYRINNYNGDLFNDANENASALMDDGTVYIFSVFGEIFNPDIDRYPNIPQNQSIGNVYIDVNGESTGSNSLGQDIFAFHLMNDGSLMPAGSTKSADFYQQEGLWRDNCNENNVTTGIACAGSIFENDLKIIYR